MNPEPKPITLYGMNRLLKPVEQGPVSLARALEVVGEYFAKLKPKYGTEEDAISQTMFGFARTKNSFLEICLNGPSDISMRFENPYRRKVLFWTVSDVFQKQIVVDSTARVNDEVTLYFNLPLAEYQLHFDGLK